MMPLRSFLRVAVAASALAAMTSTQACVAADDPSTPSPRMLPGVNCLSCHRPDGEAERLVWSAGGTIYASPTAMRDEGIPGATVLFFAPDGKTIITRAKSNDAGNFFVTKTLPKGFRVAVEYDGRRIAMKDPPPAGSCNACHSDSPIDAKGFIYAPTADDFDDK